MENKKRTRTTFYIASALIMISVSGCANLTSISRTTDVDFSWNEKKPDEQKGKVIHLDAKQRVVIQKAYGVICAEPSPDALSAVASSTSGGLTGPSDNEIAFAHALTENAGSIGLRTQTIQLMRDALYRVCEANFSRALDDSQVMMLHQKYQDVMIGILAIEQLTGVIKAQQIVLQGETSSSALARSYDLTRALSETRAELTTAESELSSLKKQKEEDQKNLDSANSQLEKAPDSEEAKQAVSESLEKLSETTKRNEDKETEISDLKEYIAVLKASKKAALSTAKTTAKGAAEFGKNVINSRLSEEASQHISTAVENIVKQVVNKNYVTDTCLAVIAGAHEIQKEKDELSTPGAENNPAIIQRKKDLLKQGNILDKCLVLIEKELDKKITQN